MALSLTEIAFLEQQIIGRHIPQILVVVSKLDTIKVGERETVLDYISHRLSEVSPNLELLPLYPINETQSEEEVLEIVKTKIENLVAKGERNVWRSYQCAHQLLDLCEQVKQYGEKVLLNANLSDTERQKEFQKQQEFIRNAQLDWNQIELDLEQKRLETYKNLENKIFAFKQDVIDLLQFQLKKTNNPKTWWQEDLPFTLRKELVSFSRKIENSIIDKIAKDNIWLEEKVNEYFGEVLAATAPKTNHKPKLMIDVETLDLADLQKYRLLTRLGSSVALISGYLLGGPIGIVASTGIWLFGENMMNKTVEEQKQLIEQELEKNVNHSLDQYCHKVADRLGEVYQNLINQLKQKEKLWKQNQQLVNQDTQDTTEVKHWEIFITQVDNLKTNINNTLKQKY